VILTLILTLLVGLPFLSTPLHKQANRLFVTALATFIVGRPNSMSLLMSNGMLVVLGDISYSVYLVHWPLITYFRYSNMNMDEISFSGLLYFIHI
jgi:peptidoglycan/LPS O-acetylase OafA/YrhL